MQPRNPDNTRPGAYFIPGYAIVAVLKARKEKA